MAEEKRVAESAASILSTKRPRLAEANHLRNESHADSLEWQTVLRITHSHGFAKSALLSNFLRYVCEKKLQGRITEITEQQIGTHAFGRPAAYNPGDDNIVRNYARILRLRLDANSAVRPFTAAKSRSTRSAGIVVTLISTR